MYLHNYSNNVNYTKQGSAREECYWLYISQLRETQTETLCCPNCLMECYYKLTLSLSQRANRDSIHASF